MGPSPTIVFGTPQAELVNVATAAAQTIATPPPPRKMLRYLLAIGRRPRRCYLTEADAWLPGQRRARRFYDRVTLRAEQIRQDRVQPRRIRVVRLRERQG